MVSPIARYTVWLRAALAATCLLLLLGNPCSSTTSRHKVLVLKGHAGVVYAVAFSPNGERLVAGTSREGIPADSISSDDNLVVWDVKTGKRLHSYFIQAAWILGVAYSPDGRRIAVATSGGGEPVMVFDANADREILRLKGVADARCVTYSTDGKRLAASDKKGTVKVWDAATGDELLSLQKRDTCVNSVAFSPDGTQLATYATSGGGVRVWNATTGKEIKHLLNNTGNFSNAVNSLHHAAFSPDGKRLAACDGLDDVVKVWDVATGKEVFSLVGKIPDDQGIAGVTLAFSPDGKWIATGGFDNIVRVWDAKNGHEKFTLKGHTSFVYGVAFSPDCKRIASASNDRTVRIWRLED